MCGRPWQSVVMSSSISQTGSLELVAGGIASPVTGAWRTRSVGGFRDGRDGCPMHWAQLVIKCDAAVARQNEKTAMEW